MAEADQEWLKQQLAAALGWDPAVAEGIVQAIATAESQDEVEQLVQVGGLDLKFLQDLLNASVVVGLIRTGMLKLCTPSMAI